MTRGGIDYPLYVATQSEWNGIIQKSTESQIPGVIYYEPTFPLGTVRLVRADRGAANNAGGQYTVAAVADIGDTLVFPPGYERALRYALAVELAPEYPAVTLSQRVIDTADEALALIKSANNTQNAPATFDVAIAGRQCYGGTLAAFLAGY